MKGIRFAALALLILVLATATCFGWQKQDLWVQGNCVAVNQQGQVAGSAYEYDAKCNLKIKPFIWSEATGFEYIPELASDGAARTYTYPTDMNDQGLMVGYQMSWQNKWVTRAWTWSASDGVNFFDQGWATAVNNLGYVLYYRSGTTANEGRLYVAPAKMSLPVGNGLLYDVNDATQATGVITGLKQPGAGRPALWNPYSAPTPAPCLPGNTGIYGTHGIGYGISNSGAVVGADQQDFGYSHAFYWDGTTPQTWDLGSTFIGDFGEDVQSYAKRVNDNGLVVGYGVDSYWNYKPLAWDITTGGMTEVLPVLNYGTAYDVNNAGMVVGNADGHAVVWLR